MDLIVSVARIFSQLLCIRNNFYMEGPTDVIFKLELDRHLSISLDPVYLVLKMAVQSLITSNLKCEILRVQVFGLNLGQRGFVFDDWESSRVETPDDLSKITLQSVPETENVLIAIQGF